MISENLKKRLITSSLLVLLIFLIVKSNQILVYSLLVLGVFSLIEFFQIINKIIKKNVFRFIFNMLFSLYIFFFCQLFFFFSSLIHLKFLLFTILIGCIASDLGGYIFGKTFKGPRLTKISPKKTFSGAAGSIIFTSVIISSLFFYYTNVYGLKIFVLGILVSLSNQAGDLFFSALKRKAKIKDTGNLLPGHGGILDRIDGILIGVPLGIIFTLLLFK
jgi:phosphatidate cytidylyltransferase